MSDRSDENVEVNALHAMDPTSENVSVGVDIADDEQATSIVSAGEVDSDNEIETLSTTEGTVAQQPLRITLNLLPPPLPTDLDMIDHGARAGAYGMAMRTLAEVVLPNPSAYPRLPRWNSKSPEPEATRQMVRYLLAKVRVLDSQSPIPNEKNEELAVVINDLLCSKEITIKADDDDRRAREGKYGVKLQRLAKRVFPKDNSDVSGWNSRNPHPRTSLSLLRYLLVKVRRKSRAQNHQRK